MRCLKELPFSRKMNKFLIQNINLAFDMIYLSLGSIFPLSILAVRPHRKNLMSIPVLG